MPRGSVFQHGAKALEIRICKHSAAAVKLLPLTPVSQLLQYLLIPAAVIALCIAVCVVLRKSFPRLYGLLTGGRG